MGIQLPGVMCNFVNAFDIDTGTLCRNASPIPGPAGRLLPPMSSGKGNGKLIIDKGVLEPELISTYTRQLLKLIMSSIELETLYVTSGIRPPERQAKTMYQNILSKGVASQLSLYGVPGQQVVKTYVVREQAGDDEDDIIDAMTEKIYELLKSGKRVSKHCVSEEAYAALNVIDVSHSRMPASKRINFENGIAKAKSLGKISKFISPRMKGGEPAYHLEIPQP